jgi:hypothetical protein
VVGFGELGSMLAALTAEGSKRRKWSGAETPSLALQRGQLPTEAATVGLKLVRQRLQ